MGLCITDNSGNNPNIQQHAWDYIKNSVCKSVPDALIMTESMESILANASKSLVPANTTLDLQAPIHLPYDNITIIMKTIQEFNNQLQYGLNYGGASCALVLGFMFLGMLNNLFHHSVTWRYNKTTTTAGSSKPKALSPSPNWIKSIRRHIINPSLFFDGVHLQQASVFGFVVSYPTRLEGILVFLFLVLNFVLLFPCYDLFNENTYWPNAIPTQLGRYLADRSGEMSFAQLPMVYLFGGRNNIMIYLTGWSYDRFIVAHKWASRVMFIHAVIHSAAYTWLALLDGPEGLTSYYEDEYIIWGAVATVLSGFILLLAIPSLRRSFYDLFLSIHIVLVVIFTVACWYHVKLLEDQENMAFLYASFAIWAYDRVVRFIRVVYYNIIFVTGQSMVRTVKADIVPGTDCIRLRVDANKKGLSHRIPGAFVYIYVPRVYFWQSHPFTIASWHQTSLDSDNMITSDSAMINEAVQIPDEKKQRPSSSPHDSAITVPTSIKQTNTFDLLIRPQKGMTKKLYEAVERLGPGGGEMYMVIEGPYGHTHPILQYDTAILIGGGVGCTATIPYLQEAVYNSTKSAAQHVVFIWVVQHDSQLLWARQDIEECLSHVKHTRNHQGSDEATTSNTVALDVAIYVTRSSTTLTEDKGKQQPEGMGIHYGVRPDLAKLIGQYIEMAPGSVGLLHCGPGRMSDDIRQISALHGLPYFEEAFNW
ncbi:ferric reductase like transmembrane component-domain-containing protein [Chlamydoabsidia padenii]|nr:ferric reductase like transmembrane component-domain-containing protein [Chlamydoabsidia padenii]